MKDGKAELLQGTLDMMVLKALNVAKMHGFGIARWIERTTEDRLVIEEGALYPALYRIKRRKWVSSEWGVSENNRKAKYYHLTDLGREELARQTLSWNDSAAAVRSVLNVANS